jgi:glycosyltransferase involved in cell wall biosynthesis
VRFYRHTEAGPTATKLLILDLLLLYQAIKLLRSKEFDLIYAHHYEGLAIALLARFAEWKPIVYDAHTMLASELPHYAWAPLRSAFRRLGRIIDRHLPKRAEHIVAVSHSVESHLARYAPASKISVVANRIETQHFSSSAWHPGNLAEQTLVFSGNMAPYQGIELMLQSVAELASSHKRLRLKILSNESFEPYSSIAESLKISHIIDCVEADLAELPAEIASASVAINPRCEGDGIPQKLLNYMAVGIPIVSSKGTAVGLRHGENALLVENGDTMAMTTAIHTILSDVELATRLGGNAKRQVLANGGWQEAAREVEESTFFGLDYSKPLPH